MTARAAGARGRATAKAWVGRFDAPTARIVEEFTTSLPVDRALYPHDVAGSRALIEFLYHRARPFLFSTSHPPAVAAACLAAIDVLEQEPQLIERLWENTRFFKTGLQQLGFNTGRSESPITPVIVGEAATAATMSDKLFVEGVFAQSIGFPTVAKGQARLRTIVSATHTKPDLEFALDRFGQVGRELGLI